MFKKIAERLAVFKPFSWEKMVGNGQVCLLLMFQVLLWTQMVNSALTRTLAGTTLILYGVLWIMHGIYPLLIENRSASVTIGCRVIIASGCCIVGLGIAMILPLMTEVDWVPRMAGIFYSLAFLLWLFVIMKVAPIITQGLLIGLVFCVIASGYALVCNVLVMNALVSDVPHVKASWYPGGRIYGEWWCHDYVDTLRYAENYDCQSQTAGACLYDWRDHIHRIRDCAGYCANISLMANK